MPIWLQGRSLVRLYSKLVPGGIWQLPYAGRWPLTPAVHLAGILNRRHLTVGSLHDVYSTDSILGTGRIYQAHNTTTTSPCWSNNILSLHLALQKFACLNLPDRTPGRIPSNTGNNALRVNYHIIRIMFENFLYNIFQITFSRSFNSLQIILQLG